MGSGKIGNPCSIIITDDHAYAEGLIALTPAQYDIIVCVNPEYVSTGEHIYCSDDEMAQELDDTLELLYKQTRITVFASDMGEVRLISLFRFLFGANIGLSYAIIHEDSRHHDDQEDAQMPSFLT